MQLLLPSKTMTTARDVSRVRQKRTSFALRNSTFKINLCYTINLNVEFCRAKVVLSPSLRHGPPGGGSGIRRKPCSSTNIRLSSCGSQGASGGGLVRRFYAQRPRSSCRVLNSGRKPRPSEEILVDFRGRSGVTFVSFLKYQPINFFLNVMFNSPPQLDIRRYPLRAAASSKPHSRTSLEAPEGVAAYAAEGGLVRASFSPLAKKVGEVRRKGRSESAARQHKPRPPGRS